MTGLTANSDHIKQQLRVSCDSGYCKWEKYQSIAVCSRCEGSHFYVNLCPCRTVAKNPKIFHPILLRKTNPISLVSLLCSKTLMACRPTPTLRGIFCHTI